VIKKLLKASWILFLAALVLSASCAFAQSDLIAIDVLIQPGPKMMSEAEEWNAMMRDQNPGGFELDEEHAPHITLIQRFIAESDLPQVLEAVGKVKSNFDISSLEMTATGLYYIPTGENGLAGIVIEPTAQLHAFSKRLSTLLMSMREKEGVSPHSFLTSPVHRLIRSCSST
jgi:hypothetical protein